MKTKPLNGVQHLVLSATWLPTMLFGIALFFPCLYFSIAFESNLAIGGCVAALLLPAFIGARVGKRTLSQIGKRPANSILFVCTAFAFEFSAFSDGPAVLGV